MIHSIHRETFELKYKNNGNDGYVYIVCSHSEITTITQWLFNFFYPNYKSLIELQNTDSFYLFIHPFPSYLYAIDFLKQLGIPSRNIISIDSDNDTHLSIDSDSIQFLKNCAKVIIFPLIHTNEYIFPKDKNLHDLLLADTYNFEKTISITLLYSKNNSCENCFDFVINHDGVVLEIDSINNLDLVKSILIISKIVIFTLDTYFLCRIFCKNNIIIIFDPEKKWTYKADTDAHVVHNIEQIYNNDLECI